MLTMLIISSRLSLTSSSTTPGVASEVLLSTWDVGTVLFLISEKCLLLTVIKYALAGDDVVYLF